MSYSSEVLADSPAVYLRLNDSSGQATDSSGNGRHGAVYGANLAYGAAGALVGDTDKAVTFPGDSGEGAFRVPYWAGLEATAQFTLEAWIKTTSTGFRSIWDRDTASGARAWQFRLNGGALEFVRIRSSVVTISKAATLNDGAWHHVACVVTGTELILYIDGLAVHRVAMSWATAADTNGISLGANFSLASGSAAKFQGQIDEAAYYTGALPDARIAAHWMAGLNEVATTAYRDAVLADAPLAYYRLGEPTALTDSTSNGRHGTLTGAPPTSPSLIASDPTDGAYDFSGSGQWARVADAAWMDVPALSIEAWCRPDTVVGTQNIGARAVASGTPAWQLQRVAAKMRFYTHASGNQFVESTTTLVAGQRYHVVATFTPDTPGAFGAGTMRLYINGVLEASGAGTLPADSNQPLAIASDSNNGSLWDGKIDEFAYYGTALSDARVLAHYDAATVIAAAATVVTIDGATPPVGGSFSAVVASDLSLAGVTPPVAGSFSLEPTAIPETVTLGGQTPPVGGSFSLVAASDGVEVALDGTTPAVEGSFTVSGALSAVTDNRVGGRARLGLGVATWEPPVVEPPANLAPALAYDVLNVYSAPTYPDSATQPVYGVTTARARRHRDRIVVGGRDITYWRGVRTPTPSYQLIDPMMWGPGSMVLPQVAAALEQPGVGALRFLRKGAPVLIQRVDVSTGAVVATDYKGFVTAHRISGADLTLELGGELSGRAGMMNKQLPIWRATEDVGRMIYGAVRDVGLKMLPRLGPETGIELWKFGGQSYADYINQIISMSVRGNGDRYTLMPTPESGVYRLRVKDTETIDATIYFDDERMKPDLTSDMAEQPDRVYATAVSPGGQRIKFGVYPGLRQGPPPPYPFNNHNRVFGGGTTNAETDTGDGISVMIYKLVVSGYLDFGNDTYPGGYDADVTRAVKALQRDAGLEVTGDVNYKTWRALYDLDATGFSLTWSKILPAAEKDRVRRWNRTASGALRHRNRQYNPTAIKVDINIDVGTGFTRNKTRDFAERELVPEDNWVGNVNTLNALARGQHAPGSPVTAADVLPPRAIRPGMVLWAPLFDGGTKFHVSGVTVSDDGARVSMMLDTQFRETIKVWQIAARNRETRRDPARAWIQEHRGSQMQKDSMITWDEIGGTIDNSIELEADKWTVFPVLAGQEGTIARLRLKTTNPAEYVVAMFGKAIGPGKLQARIGNPLTPAGSKRWENEAIRNKLDRENILLYVAGNDESPCGYFPKSKSPEDETPKAELTGRWDDDAGIPYRTFKHPVIYVAVYADRNTRIKPGRIMWPQLEEGS